MLSHTTHWASVLAVMFVVMLTAVTRTHCAKRSRKLEAAGLRVERTDGPDDVTNVSDNDKFEQPVPRRVDPQGSWFAFVRHSDRSNRKHQNKNRDRKKKKKSLRGLPGPRGPPGPQGPPGPPGAHITKEVLMKEFKEMVKEEAERRAEKLIAQRCPACPLKTNSSHILPIHDIEELNIIPRVTSGFHVSLRGNVKVSRRTFQELQTFHVPFQEGAFQRGDPFDEKGARFTASREGVYQFTTNLKVQPKHKKKHTTLKRRDIVRVLICIDSLCQKHASLEYISGMESNSRTFTVSLSGMLYMKRGQYTSIHLDNASGMSLVIHAGSDFSGILLGV